MIKNIRHDGNYMTSFFEYMYDLANPEKILKFQESYFNGFSFIFGIKDRNHKFLEVNDFFASEIGFKNRSDLQGLTDADLYPESFSKPIHFNDKKIIQSRTPSSFYESAMIPNYWKIDAISYKTPLRSLYSKKINGVIFFSVILNKGSSNSHFLPETESKKIKSNLLLTARQVDCLKCFIKGMTMKQVGKTLNLSPRTIEHYLEIIKIKLNCKTRNELIKKGLQLGFDLL